MRPSDQSPDWIGKTVRTVIVAGAAFLILGFEDTWELSVPIRLGIASTFGILFFLLGKSAWNWIHEFFIWS
jgi:hypothetical protein